MAEHSDAVPPAEETLERRGFFSSVAMLGGLSAGYGMLLVMAGRYLYLYPAGARTKAWQFVTELRAIKVGEAIDFVRAVAPVRAFPIHDALLSEKGKPTTDRWFTTQSGTEYVRLSPGESAPA